MTIFTMEMYDDEQKKEEKRDGEYRADDEAAKAEACQLPVEPFEYGLPRELPARGNNDGLSRCLLRVEIVEDEALVRLRARVAS